MRPHRPVLPFAVLTLGVGFASSLGCPGPAPHEASDGGAAASTTSSALVVTSSEATTGGGGTGGAGGGGAGGGDAGGGGRGGAPVSVSVSASAATATASSSDAASSTASGIVACPTGTAHCSDPNMCVDIASSVDHCGPNCEPCATDHVGMPVCNLGRCVPICLDGYSDGNAQTANDGCEARIERVFVTSTLVTLAVVGSGTTGRGLTVAKKACADAATQVPVSGPGRTWKPWISDGSHSPSTDFDHSETTVYRLVRPAGVGGVIATGWSHLTSPTGLAAAIANTESGAPPIDPEARVWTATLTSGESSGEDCGGWKMADASGRSGNMGTQNEKWTFEALVTCSVPLRVYCFEEP